MRRALGGLALGLAIATAGCGGAETRVPEGTPIFVISIDTLRADRLPAWGYQGVRTPAIDALAADGIVYENAWSNVPLTLPSHVTILTGRRPDVHGVRNNIGYAWDVEKHPPVTAALRREGYATGAAISAWVLRGATGMAKAFDFLDDGITSRAGAATGSVQRDGTATTAIAKRWIDEQGDRPLFFLLHLFEPHAPYEPPPALAERYAASPYDGEVAATDAIVGGFLDHLRARGLYERSLIIFLSDHGEGLGDHGEDEHGVFLYREAIHVPLIVKLPRGERKGTRVATPVQLADVAPTIAALTGIETGRTDGVSLLGELPPDRAIVSETFYPRLHLGWSELRSLVDGRHHFIEAPRPELFDYRSDPRETANVMERERRTFARLREWLAAVPKNFSGPAAIDPDEAARLAALGYIGSVGGSEGDLPDPKDRIAELEVLKKGGRLAAEGRLEEAVTLYRSALDGNPGLADGWSLLGSALERLGRTEEAIEAYQGGIRSSPALRGEMALAIASVQLRNRELDEAESHARLALGSAPAAAHLMLARVALAREQWDRAEEEALLASADATMKPHASIVRALAMGARGRTVEGLQLLAAVAAEAGDRGLSVEDLYYAFGDLFARAERWTEAERSFRTEIEHFPRNLRAWTSLAVVYAVSGQEEKVDSLLDRMVRENRTEAAARAAAQTRGIIGE